MQIDRRRLIAGAGATALAPPAWAQGAAVEAVVVDVRQTTGPLAHIWEECVGSDRAATTLREVWRRDLERWREETGVKRVRFHGILADELGVYAPSILNRNHVTPNFQNVDLVYDGLLERGVSPFVELSFMPKQLASGAATFGFYKANISPPQSLEDWSRFIGAFVAHLVERYGRATVREWPFEVWNEPNLPFFWSGDRQQYFDLYKATAVAVKSIDPAIPVGGPSTATLQWLPEFTRWAHANNAPVDFITTHLYAGDDQKEIFPDGLARASYDVIPQALAQGRRAIDSGPMAGKPLWLTEWSSDSPAMIAHVVKESLAHCQAMSQWALSAAFEELGVPDFILKEGDTGWGMMVQGVAKPPYNTYKLLHRLGDQRLFAEGPVLAATRRGGRPAALVWNLADAKQPSGIPGLAHTRQVVGEPKRLAVEFRGARPGQGVRISYVDQARGSAMPAWRAMGSPQYPSRDQLRRLQTASAIQPPEMRRLDRQGRLALDLPPEGVALVEFV